MSDWGDWLLADIRARHPRSLRGLEEAVLVDGPRFHRSAQRFLGWAAAARGPEQLGPVVDAFVQFSTDVNLAQARYEASGSYESQTYAEVAERVYQRREVMDEYLWGVYLTNFCWAHHLDLTALYEDRFLARLPERARLVELAPGHGGWGLHALDVLPGATLEAFDISPSSLHIARGLSRAAGMEARARHELRDALTVGETHAGRADAVICNFLIEHLETPERLVEVMHQLLVPGGRAFLSGALTAAQVDHIFEFVHESELLVMAERCGFRVLEARSVAPARTLPRARFLPRSISLILERRSGGA